MVAVLAPNNPPPVLVFVVFAVPKEKAGVPVVLPPKGLVLFWLLLPKRLFPLEPKPVLVFPPPNAFVVVLFEVPKSPGEEVLEDCWPKRPPAGLLPNRPPLPNPVVEVLVPNPDAEEVLPNGLLVLLPKDELF